MIGALSEDELRKLREGITPGPLAFGQDEDGKWIVVTPTGGLLARMAGPPGPMNKANAWLYGLAPDLLDAHLALTAELAAARAREAELVGALKKAANRLDWCAGLIEIDSARDKAGPWGEEARAAIRGEKAQEGET